MPSFKNYVAVQFINNTHAVVPNHWVQTLNGALHCKWPAVDNVDSLSENNTQPEEKWTTSRVKKILAQSSTFRGAELKQYPPGGGETDTVEQPDCKSFVSSSGASTQYTTSSPAPTRSIASSAASTQSVASSAATCVAPSPRAFKLHKPIIAPTPVSITDPCRKDCTATEKINNKIDVLLDMSRSNSRDIKKILAILEPQKPSATCAQPVSTFHRATSMEELDQIATNPTVMTELQRCVGVSLRDTTRRMMQRIITADVAKGMSYSGLGQARQRTKIAFKELPACQLILEVLAAGGFTNHKEIAVATQRGLRGSVDWDGSRHHRGTGATEATERAGIATTTNISTITTTVSSDTVPSPNITYAAELVPSSDLIVESDSE